MASTPSSTTFSDLPIDVVESINDRLDDASKLALRLANSGLYHNLSRITRATNTSSCKASLIQSYVNIDKANAFRECAFCKHRYPLDSFPGSYGGEYTNPESEEQSTTRKRQEQQERDFLDRKGFGLHGTVGMVPLPDRVCYEHRNDFLLLQNQSLAQNPVAARRRPIGAVGFVDWAQQLSSNMLAALRASTGFTVKFLNDHVRQFREDVANHPNHHYFANVRYFTHRYYISVWGLVSSPFTKNDVRTSLFGRPTSWRFVRRKMCMHCQTISAELWRQTCPVRWCKCDFCGVREIKVLKREGSMPLPQRYAVWYEDGVYTVKEWGDKTPAREYVVEMID